MFKEYSFLFGDGDALRTAKMATHFISICLISLSCRRPRNPRIAPQTTISLYVLPSHPWWSAMQDAGVVCDATSPHRKEAYPILCLNMRRVHYTPFLSILRRGSPPERKTSHSYPISRILPYEIRALAGHEQVRCCVARLWWDPS